MVVISNSLKLTNSSKRFQDSRFEEMPARKSTRTALANANRCHLNIFLILLLATTSQQLDAEFTSQRAPYERRLEELEKGGPTEAPLGAASSKAAGRQVSRAGSGPEASKGLINGIRVARSEGPRDFQEILRGRLADTQTGGRSPDRVHKLYLPVQAPADQASESFQANRLLYHDDNDDDRVQMADGESLQRKSFRAGDELNEPLVRKAYTQVADFGDSLFGYYLPRAARVSRSITTIRPLVFSENYQEHDRRQVFVEVGPSAVVHEPRDSALMATHEPPSAALLGRGQPVKVSGGGGGGGGKGRRQVAAEAEGAGTNWPALAGEPFPVDYHSSFGDRTKSKFEHDDETVGRNLHEILADQRSVGGGGSSRQPSSRIQFDQQQQQEPAPQNDQSQASSEEYVQEPECVEQEPEEQEMEYKKPAKKIILKKEEKHHHHHHHHHHQPKEKQIVKEVKGIHNQPAPAQLEIHMEGKGQGKSKPRSKSKLKAEGKEKSKSKKGGEIYAKFDQDGEQGEDGGGQEEAIYLGKGEELVEDKKSLVEEGGGGGDGSGEAAPSKAAGAAPLANGKAGDGDKMPTGAQVDMGQVINTSQVPNHYFDNYDDRQEASGAKEAEGSGGGDNEEGSANEEVEKKAGEAEEEAGDQGGHQAAGGEAQAKGVAGEEGAVSQVEEGAKGEQEEELAKKVAKEEKGERKKMRKEVNVVEEKELGEEKADGEKIKEEQPIVEEVKAEEKPKQEEEEQQQPKKKEEQSKEKKQNPKHQHIELHQHKHYEHHEHINLQKPEEGAQEHEGGLEMGYHQEHNMPVQEEHHQTVERDHFPQPMMELHGQHQQQPIKEEWIVPGEMHEKPAGEDNLHGTIVIEDHSLMNKHASDHPEGHGVHYSEEIITHPHGFGLTPIAAFKMVGAHSSPAATHAQMNTTNSTTEAPRAVSKPNTGRVGRLIRH